MMFTADPTRVLAVQLPNIDPQQPPGTDGITTLLGWLSWIAIIAGLAGFLVSLSVLAFSAWSGREMTGVKGLVIGIVVCILAISAGTIIQVFV